MYALRMSRPFLTVRRSSDTTGIHGMALVAGDHVVDDRIAVGIDPGDHRDVDVLASLIAGLHDHASLTTIQKSRQATHPPDTPQTGP
jgi:hypothetical protein